MDNDNIYLVVKEDNGKGTLYLAETDVSALARSVDGHLYDLGQKQFRSWAYHSSHRSADQAERVKASLLHDMEHPS